MGIAEVKAAFQQTIGDAYDCTLALMDIEHAHGIEYQRLFFRVSGPDGVKEEIRSDQIRPGGDLIQAAKDTALRLLNQKTPS
jgi:hypothetical protein